MSLWEDSQKKKKKISLNSVHYRVLFGLHGITNCYNKLHGICSNRLSKTKCLPTGCKHRPLKKMATKPLLYMQTKTVTE